MFMALNLKFTTNCEHIADEYENVQVRLLGGANPTEGRVEVFYNGRWGSVCQDNFGAWEAAVVCKMLGLE